MVVDEYDLIHQTHPQVQNLYFAHLLRPVAVSRDPSAHIHPSELYMENILLNWLICY